MCVHRCHSYVSHIKGSTFHICFAAVHKTEQLFVSFLQFWDRSNTLLYAPKHDFSSNMFLYTQFLVGFTCLFSFTWNNFLSHNFSLIVHVYVLKFLFINNDLKLGHFFVNSILIIDCLMMIMCATVFLFCSTSISVHHTLSQMRLTTISFDSLMSKHKLKLKQKHGY